MREISETNLGFEDTKTRNTIMCAFSLDNICKPECAACEVWGTGPKASCKRGEGEDFIIGLIRE